MYKFSEIEKDIISNDALLAIKESKHDAEDLHYVTEVFAARFLIKKFVGDEWFLRALSTIDFKKIKRSTKAEVPPISYYLGVQKTERHFKFIKFAMYLKHLAGNSNFEDKKDEYLDEQKKRKSIFQQNYLIVFILN